MFGKICFVGEDSIFVELNQDIEIKNSILNSHVVIEDRDKSLLGEIFEINKGNVKIKFIGEFQEGKLQRGIIRKPFLDASVRPVTDEEISIILGKQAENTLVLGVSPFYNGQSVYFNINDFFSNHFAIFGNSGSGKSCGVARLIQNVFSNNYLRPYNANFILFDVSGEYSQALSNLNNIDPNYNYRVFSTGITNDKIEPLRIPLWLLNSSDLALLLMSNSHSQLPIIERMLKLTKAFSESSNIASAFKDHLIAKAIISVLFSDSAPAKKKNDIFAIVENCSTPNFNLEAVLTGVGYTRKFRDCFNIDKFGTFTESILLTEYVSSFVNDKFDDYEPSGQCFYSLLDLEKALDFTLISEGWYRNENTYADAATIKVRLHSLVTGPYSKIFDYGSKVNTDQYLSNLFFKDNKKCQIININLDDMDDSIASVITKILTRLIFDFSKTVPKRGSVPFHIFVEEAHRYIKKDNDHYLIGYNIFERVAKEGRKYGVILGVISQRPVELSDTVISQCSNFLIFKTNHPCDEDYIRRIIPNINADIVDKQKELQSGSCLAFGSAFEVPTIVKLELPNPTPLSNNSNIISFWGNINR